MKISKILAGSFLLNATLLLFHSHAAPGDVDLSFDPGSGVSSYVYATAVHSDGKIIIGGDFATVRGAVRNRIARLNADGSADGSFNPGTGLNDTVYSVAVQSNGKVLAGGWFTGVNGTNRSYVVRLNADGSVDNTFNPGAGPNLYVQSVAAQTNGQVLIGGYFTSVNGTNRNHIARLNGDGSVDNFFNPGTGANGLVYSIVVQPDGKVLIAGDFTKVNDVDRNRIARLNADGGLDGNFNPGTGADGAIKSISLQADGKVVIGGSFYTVNGVSRNFVARLNGDGGLDNTFSPTNGPGSYVQSVAVQTNGQVVIGGGFLNVNGTSRYRIARLNADGSLDDGFNPGTGASYDVYSVALQSDGKVLIGGGFTTVNEAGRDYFVRLNTDGSVDGSFVPTTGANGLVLSVTPDTNGKVLIGGYFTHINGVGRSGVARLNTDGSLDGTFEPGTGTLDPLSGINYPVESVAVLTNGQVLIGGEFYTVNGTNRHGVARLNSDGSLDGSFNPGTGTDNKVFAVAAQTDGKVLIGGRFFNVNGVSRNHIARLNTNGSVDMGFDPGTGASDDVGSIALQTDGKVLIGGAFSGVNGAPRHGIARLNADGSVDGTFNPGTAMASYVLSIAPQTDGKLVIGGHFETINGTNRNNVARLNADGSLDPSFVPGTGTFSDVFSVALQSNGKVLIAGYFNSVNGVSRNAIARLNTDGSLDNSFNPGGGPISRAGTPSGIETVAVQADGTVLVGGGFASFNDVARWGVARLQTDQGPAAFRIDPIVRSDANVNLFWNSISGRTYHVQFKANLTATTWTDLPPDITATSSIASKTDTLANPQRFYRAVLLP